MTEDFIDATFADLYYPGSKRKRREPVTKVVEDTTWDAKGFKKTLPNGKEVDMFTIGALADALGRPIITLRKWMEEGYLPTSPYRLPAKVDKKGKVVQGRRLYTRPMIEKAVELFSKAGVLHAKRIEWSSHQKLSKEISDSWSNIQAMETETIETTDR
jgi:hypothetical protein